MNLIRNTCSEIPLENGYRISRGTMSKEVTTACILQLFQWEVTDARSIRSYFGVDTYKGKHTYLDNMLDITDSVSTFPVQVTYGCPAMISLYIHAEYTWNRWYV